MGGAHIGVLEVLAENSIPLDIIVGSSAGAAVGASSPQENFRTSKNS